MLSLFSSSSLPHRASLGRLVSQGTLLLMVSIGTLILILALLILFHQNSTATKGYQLRSLERERSRLLLEEEVLKMQVAESQALEELENSNLIQAMVQIRNPLYSDSETTMAQEDNVTKQN